MPATRRIQVRFFAILREQAGVSALECETPARTPAELYQELAGARGLTVPAALLRVAINDRYATLETPLRPDDRVVFLPPVAGG
jgi:molybdopterin converting factor subunit 1